MPQKRVCTRTFPSLPLSRKIRHMGCVYTSGQRGSVFVITRRVSSHRVGGGDCTNAGVGLLGRLGSLLLLLGKAVLALVLAMGWYVPNRSMPPHSPSPVPHCYASYIYQVCLMYIWCV